MKLEEQVVSLDLARKLKALGVKQESYFFYSEAMPVPGIIPHYEIQPELSVERFSAFTVAELGEMLGVELTDANESDSFTLKCTNAIDFWCVTFGNDEIDITPQFENPKIVDALAEIHIYSIENRLMEAPSE